MQAYPLTPPGLSSMVPAQLNVAACSKSPLPALRPSVDLSDPLSLLSDEQELAPRKSTPSVFTIPSSRLPSSVETSVIYVAVPAMPATTTTITAAVLDIVVPIDAALITPFPTRAVTFTRSSRFRVTEGSKKLWKLAALNVCTARHRAAMARRVQQQLEDEAKEKDNLEKERERMKNRPTILQDLKNLAAKPRQPLCPATVTCQERTGGTGKQAVSKERDEDSSEVEVEFIITPIRIKSDTTLTARPETVHVKRRVKNGSVKLRKLAAVNACVQKHSAATKVDREEAEKTRFVKKENRMRDNRIKLALQISTMAEGCLAARAGSRLRRKPAPTLSRMFEAEISSAGVAVMA